MRRPHRYSTPTTATLELLGHQIAAARRARRWTAAELAERAGISPGTLRKAERGDPTVAAGILIECAVLVGVPLYTPDPDELPSLARQVRDTLTLLPARIRPTPAVDDNF